MKTLYSILILCLSLLILMGGNVNAEQTDNCHCFRKRSYDPADKTAADEYLLTTSFNSLIAATLGVSKREIVMLKMKGGVDPDTLLTALYIADRSTMELKVILAVHDNGGSWQEIVKAPGVRAKISADPALQAIAAGASLEERGDLITTALLKSRYKAWPETIKNLGNSSFSNRETALLFALQEQAGASLTELTRLRKDKKMSWSELAHLYSLTPSGVGEAIIATK